MKHIPATADVIVGVINPSKDILRRIGFTDDMSDGETVLPLPAGKTSLYNAEGKELIDKSKPKETAYRTREWTWSQWHGRDRIERTEIVDVPYKRYPRSFLPPPSVELSLTTDSEGNKIVSTAVIKGWKSKESEVVHATNLVLELFGEVTFFDSSLARVVSAPVKRLNWNLLPPGKRPFPQLKREIGSLLATVKSGNRPFAEHRLETINKYEPDFAAVGTAGFTGYIVLGFQKAGVYVLESLLYGNATYVLDERWETLSQKTKAEILTGNLHEARLIHHKAWQDDLRNLFKKKGV